MALEKAKIELLKDGRVETSITVLFNPSEYTLERSNAYKATSVPGLGGPLIHFINGEADSLSMDLFLDDYTDAPKDGGKSVKELLEELGNLLEIKSGLHAPPIVRFVWGKLIFKAILEKMSRKLTLFRPDGQPARATVSVTFKEYRTLAERLREPRLESSDKSKRRLIVGRDSLWLLAAREYGDAALWRRIADENDFDDPRDIRPGDWVTLPPLEPDRGTSRSR